LTPFPFTDLSGFAVRPALVVSQKPIVQDIVVVAISSVVRSGLAPTDCLIDTAHPEFALTGLRVKSVIRTHKLGAVDRSVIVKRLGRVGPQLQAEVDRLLRIILAL